MPLLSPSANEAVATDPAAAAAATQAPGGFAMDAAANSPLQDVSAATPTQLTLALDEAAADAEEDGGLDGGGQRRRRLAKPGSHSSSWDEDEDEAMGEVSPHAGDESLLLCTAAPSGLSSMLDIASLVLSSPVQAAAASVAPLAAAAATSGADGDCADASLPDVAAAPAPAPSPPASPSAVAGDALLILDGADLHGFAVMIREWEPLPDLGDALPFLLDGEDLSLAGLNMACDTTSLPTAAVPGGDGTQPRRGKLSGGGARRGRAGATAAGAAAPKAPQQQPQQPRAAALLTGPIIVRGLKQAAGEGGSRARRKLLPQGPVRRAGSMPPEDDALPHAGYPGEKHRRQASADNIGSTESCKGTPPGSSPPLPSDSIHAGATTTAAAMPIVFARALGPAAAQAAASLVGGGAAAAGSLGSCSADEPPHRGCAWASVPLARVISTPGSLCSGNNSGGEEGHGSGSAAAAAVPPPLLPSNLRACKSEHYGPASCVLRKGTAPLARGSGGSLQRAGSSGGSGGSGALFGAHGVRGGFGAIARSVAAEAEAIALKSYLEQAAGGAEHFPK